MSKVTFDDNRKTIELKRKGIISNGSASSSPFEKNQEK